MSTPEHFTALLDHLPGAKAGSMFGYPCLKIGRKPFAFWSVHSNDAVAFKLSGAEHENALSRSGARLFDPKGEGKPMRNWVEVPAEYQRDWPELALLAFENLQHEINE